MANSLLLIFSVSFVLSRHCKMSYVITCPVKFGIKLLIRSQISTVVPLILHFIMDLITYPLGKNMVIQWPLVRQHAALNWSKMVLNILMDLIHQVLFCCEVSVGWSRSTKSLWPSDAYIYINDLTIISSDNGLSPDRHQAIIWTNAGILLIGHLEINFN